MRIKELELTNFGPHEHLHVVLGTTNLVGIIGPNGTGKTNILTAVVWLLTGLLDDDQATYIRNYAPGAKREFAAGRLVFDHQGKTGEIRRRVTPTTSSRELSWDGSTIKAAKEIDRIMTELFGVSRGSLAASGCVKQGEMDKLFYGTVSERQDLFKKMLNLGPIEPLARKIATYTNRLRVALVDHRPQLATLSGQKLELQEQLSGLRIQLEGFTNLEQKVSQLRTWLEIHDDIRRINQRLSQRQEHAENAVVNRNRELARLGLSAVDVTIRDKELQSLRDSRLAAEREMGKVQKLESHKQALAEAEGEATRKGTRKQAADAEFEEARNLESQTRGAVLPDAAIAAIEQTFRNLCLIRDTDVEALESSLRGKTIMLALFEKNLRTADEASTACLSEVGAATGVRDAVSAALRVTAGCGCPACGNQNVDRETVAEILKKAEARLQEVTAVLAERQAASRRAASAFQLQQAQVSELRAKLETAKSQVAEASGMLVHGMILTPEQAANRQFVTDLAITTQVQLQSAKGAKTEHAGALSRLRAADTAKSRADEDAQQANALVATKLTLVKSFATERTREQLTEEMAVLDSQIESIEASLMELRPMMDLVNSTEEVVKATQRELSGRTQDAEAHEKTMAPWFVQGRARESVAEELLAAEASEANRIRILGACDAMVKQKDSLDAEIRRVEALVAENDARLDATEKLKALETALGPNGVPGLYMQHVYETVLQESAPILAQMGAPFQTLPDKGEPLALRFRRLDAVDGELMPQSKLSGGQRVLVTMAMLLAVQKLILRDVGFLALDEPSLHLSEDVVPELRNTLVNLADALEGSDSQLWVIDHHKGLQSAFRNPIVLGANK